MPGKRSARAEHHDTVVQSAADGVSVCGFLKIHPSMQVGYPRRSLPVRARVTFPTGTGKMELELGEL